jgi:hypothetical protein
LAGAAFSFVFVSFGFRATGFAGLGAVFLAAFFTAGLAGIALYPFRERADRNRSPISYPQ